MPIPLCLPLHFIRHPLSDELAVQRSFGSKLRELVDNNTQFVASESDKSIITSVLSQVELVADAAKERTEGLDEECVRENEVQTETQAEEEAAQEEQRMSMFARDDEQPNPWPADLLAKVRGVYVYVCMCVCVCASHVKILYARFPILPSAATSHSTASTASTRARSSPCLPSPPTFFCPTTSSSHGGWVWACAA